MRTSLCAIKLIFLEFVARWHKYELIRFEEAITGIEPGCIPSELNPIILCAAFLRISPRIIFLIYISRVSSFVLFRSQKNMKKKNPKIKKLHNRNKKKSFGEFFSLPFSEKEHFVRFSRSVLLNSTFFAFA